jgi:hypothetical protein
MTVNVKRMQNLRQGLFRQRILRKENVRNFFERANQLHVEII